jgi:glycosyltransferase involved in cell wall biosynthesis
VAAFTLGILEALGARADLDVSAFGLTWRGRGELHQHLPAGVRSVDRPMAARPLRAMWRRWDGPVIERWTGEIDVVHGTNFVVPPTRAAAQVVTVHDLTPVRFPELVHRASLAFPALLRRALGRGAWVHTVSAFVAGEVVDLLGADPDRVVTVQQGVPAVPASPPGAGTRLARSRRYVLALGTIEPRKDHPALVRAFDAVAATAPDVNLVVAGPDGWGADALSAALERARHRRRIVRFGYVGDAERAALLRDASVFAFPSRYEGFGLPPLEAMAVGVPVVATSAGSLPEVLGDAALLVPPGDEEALAGAIARGLDDEELRARLVAAGKARAGRYSWEQCGSGLAELYRQAAASR